MQFDRLYFSVRQIEAEIWDFWSFGPSRALPDIWTGKNTSSVGPEVPMTERTGRAGNFNTSVLHFIEVTCNLKANLILKTFQGLLNIKTNHKLWFITDCRKFDKATAKLQKQL